ncbi:hypothetical protein [Nocardioides daphniae]|uniref:FAD-binding FR-type domain-containing protein n=1 Tax=Nocardioides daphniae TaxID=402297 RepID=A0A4P7UCP5_9ACTN|nr:hypothetical protein [Nocardioides daphniae]QCC77125.1 hypothetical protein E2C04_07705 [Nocardioides daphniae]
MTTTTSSAPGPLRVRGEVLAVRRAGAFRVLTLSAPGVPAAFRPGTFVVVSPGDDRLTARAWWIHRVEAAGAFGPTIEVVIDPATASGAWFAGLPVGTRLGLTGPLGRPFTLPGSRSPRCWWGRATRSRLCWRSPSGSAPASAG